MPWLVARTEAQKEFKACDLFAAHQIAAYCPCVSIPRRRGRQMLVVATAMFPRYVFTEASARVGQVLHDEGRLARKVGRLSFLSRMGIPQVLRDEVVDEVKKMEQEVATQPVFEHGLNIGQRVRLGEIEATILALAGRKVKVGFSLFGAERSVTVPADRVRVMETAVG